MPEFMCGQTSWIYPGINNMLFTTFCMALVVKRPPLREIKRALVLKVIEFRTLSHIVIDCLTAGVIKILRSLLPSPMVDKISEVT